MSTVILTENLSKWYGNILGVSDINLDIGSGIKGLLGPNGAGKSTLLKLITGQLRPNLGKIALFGETIFGNHRLFSRIGFCPEYDSYYSEMSGRQFVSFMAKIRGLKGVGQNERSSLALERVGLIDCAERLIRTYSFGMRQRLRLGASIVHDPELLLLDEPLRGIDPLWRIRIIKFIKELGKEGRSIIVSSHILPEIESMTNDIILIHQGKVFAEGDIHYIRGLIDSHPHQISLRLKNPRLLAERLVGRDFVQSVEVTPKSAVVTFRTANRDRFYETLMEVLAAEDFSVEEITSPDDNLQSIFDYLIGR